MIFPALLSIAAALQGGQIPPALLPPVPAPTAVMATVNGKPILASDIDKLMWDQFAYQATNDVILFRLIQARAATDKVSVTPAEIQATFDKQIADIKTKVPAGQEMDTFLRQQGFPKSRLYLHIVADLLLTKIVDLKFKPSDYVSISAITIPTKTGSVDELHDATGKAQDVYNRLTKNNEDWDKVLASTNPPPQVLQNHGVYGWVQVDAFPPLTKAEVKTLKVHQFTKPVQIQNNIQIFRIDAIGSDANVTGLEDLKKKYEDNAKRTLVGELQKDAKIEFKLGKPGK